MYTWNPSFYLDVTESIVNHIQMRIYKNRPQNLLEAFYHHLKKFPTKALLIDEERQLTYSQFDQMTTSLAKNFSQKYGVKKGDRIALCMKNTVGFCLSAFAVLKLGAIVVPLNTKLKVNEFSVLLEKANPKLLIADDEYSSLLPGIIPILQESEAMQIAAENQEDPAEEWDWHGVKEDDPAFILFTSGTTGQPKGAVLSHFNAIHAAINYERCYGIGEQDTTIISVPIFHGTGLFAQFTAFIYLGGTIVLLKTFDPEKMLKLSEKHKVTHTIVVPTIYTMLLNLSSHQQYHLHYKVLGSGGAPLPEALDQKIRGWLPNVKLINTYGLTEATSPALIMPWEKAEEKVGSVGIPSPIMECKVTDPITSEEVRSGTPGELLLKGPLIILKYWENEEATSKAMIDGWFKTGDIAVMDEEGFIYIKDRVKDMINRGGEKVYSTEVEDVLYRHPQVLEAAVVGIPHALYGEVPKAYIVLKSNEVVAENEIKQWVGKYLAKYKIPHEVQFIDRLPRNAGGKVMKHQLK